MKPCRAPRALFAAAGALLLVTAVPASAPAQSKPESTIIHWDPLPTDRGGAGPNGAAGPNPRNPRSTWVGLAGEALGTTDTRVPCIGTGADGDRVEVIYAHPSDYDSRYSTYQLPIQVLAANINREVLASAGETRGLRQLRFVTNRSCQPIVRNVRLSLDSTRTDFNEIVGDLAAKGYGASNRLYLVYLDGKVSTWGQLACGIAGGFPATYAIASDSCWSDVDDHELAHALGAVHSIAPHASGDGHCTDQHDILCGDYGVAPRIVTFNCPFWHHDLFDCGHNDYFHTNPRSGSFLALNPDSNTANSRFLDRRARPLNDTFSRALSVRAGIVWGSNVRATVQSGEPATAGSAPSHSIWFKITTEAGKQLSVETYASSVDTVLGLYTGSSVGALTLRAQNDNALSTVQYSRIRLSSTLATTYYIRVDGKDGTVGSVRLNVGYSDAVPKLVSVSPKFADATPPSPTIVTLNGADLLGSPASYTIATFNGRGANYNPPSSSTAYRVSPPPMAASGPVTLFTPSGFVQTDGIVRILPKIASFSPTAGPPGTDVEVRGTGFYSAVVPRFTVGGATAQVLSVFWDYDATAGAFKGLVATIRVPSGAPSGDIRVSTSIGSASAGTFTVTP